MDKQQALEWLVENVGSWPLDICEYSRPIAGWDFWILLDGDVAFATTTGWRAWPDEGGSKARIISQDEWLEAKSKQE